MATPTADKLKFYFPSKYLSADGGAITQQTADTGGTVKTIVDSALTQADDYWNGAIGWFDADTTTVALRGCFFHIKAFDADTDKLTLSKSLPAAPAAGDTYRMILGGNYRSAQELFGLEVGGVLPELFPVTPAAIPGLTIIKASGALGTGDITIRYTAAAHTLELKRTGEDDYGLPLDISADLSGSALFCADESGYLLANITASSLPGTDQTATYTLTAENGVFAPDFEGYETGPGKIRYRLLVVKNTGDDAMIDLAAYLDKPAGTATTIAAGSSLTVAAGSFVATSAADWPAKSFWIRNTTKNDCRYVIRRSGNTIYCDDATGGLRGFTAAAWEAADDVEIMPDVDLGIESPTTNQFSNPASETAAPGSVTFSAPDSVAAAIELGDLAASAIYGVWLRETIMEMHRARAAVEMTSRFQWS